MSRWNEAGGLDGTPTWLMDAQGRVLGFRDRVGNDYVIPSAKLVSGAESVVPGAAVPGSLDTSASVLAALTPTEAAAVKAQTAAGTNYIILSSGSQTANALLKTGPGRVMSIVQVSGAGKPTLRDGTTVAGTPLTGWGAGGASGLTLTANTPFSPSTTPTDFTTGLFLEINGTATCIVFFM